MKDFLVLAVINSILIICESTARVFEPLASESSNTDKYLNTLQIIRKYGYPAESHTVKTADGYLLALHRIPHGRHSKWKLSEQRKPPVYIQHGLLGSSADFLLMGAPNALAFLLADLGFDVWLGNVRGNVYTKAHVTLFPDNVKFWDFTWHQSAIYDVPAQINFICEHTKHEKIIYIGYSMGTTMFFVMTSILPAYNDKIELSLLLAPVAYVNHVKSPLLLFFAIFGEEIKALDDHILNGEFLPQNNLLKLFEEFFCMENNISKNLCESLIFLIVGKDPQQFDTRLLPTLLNHYPVGYSAKGVNHYAQLIKSGKFRQYDYGVIRNILEYGTSTPPDYNLTNIRVPMYFYVGKNDYLSTMQDVQHLAPQLSTLRKMRVIDYPAFSHLDFLISLEVKKLLYDLLLKDLISHLNDNNNASFSILYRPLLNNSIKSSFSLNNSFKGQTGKTMY